MISMYVKREGSERRSEEGRNFLGTREEQSCESQPLEIVLITRAPRSLIESLSRWLKEVERHRKLLSMLSFTFASSRQDLIQISELSRKV